MYQTAYIADELEGCEDIEDLKSKILPLLTNQRNAWAYKMEEILQTKGYSCRRMAQLCKVSEPAVRKWRRGSLPQSRDMYIRIGFAAGYSLAEMNAFLMRYGKCPKLYVKSLEDSVCIFVLRSATLEHTYETYQRLLDMVRQEIQGTADNEQVLETQDYSTQYLSTRFWNVEKMEEMVAFAGENAQAFRRAYDRLYQTVNIFLAVNLGNEYLTEQDGRRASFHAMAEESQWSSSLRHCISEIRQRKWFPLRHKVISLGLHLNMDVQSINDMLACAQMEPLYAKNPIEAAIMWAINEAKLNSENDEIVQNGSSELCEFVRDALEQLDLEEEGRYLIEDL